jgi:regulator of RNase E activity RraA
MAARMKCLGVKAAVVSGRVRDLAELHESGLPVCIIHSRYTSPVLHSFEFQQGWTEFDADINTIPSGLG